MGADRPSGDAETALPGSVPTQLDGSPPSARGPTSSAVGDWTELPTVEAAHYHLTRELARGGMGRIFTARDRRLGRDVAVKEVIATDAALVARFDREVRLTARLQHPGIVSIYEAGKWASGEPFYAMRLIEGRPFSEAIAGAATLPARLALVPHVVAIAEALAYAHGQRIIHRDLKPANVLVGRYGETVVIDWGLAKDLASAAPEVAVGAAGSDAHGLTQFGAVMGTPSYMPVEQALGQPVDERADVYAVGAILYETLGGRAPYTGESAHGILARLVAGPPPSLRERAPDAPPELLTIVERAMAREAADRYATAQALAEDLRRYTTGQLVPTHRYTPRQLLARWLRKHRSTVAVAAAALVVLAALGAWSVVNITRQRDAATRAASAAEAARRDEAHRADDVVLVEARRALESDPTLAAAWLKRLSNGSPNLAAAQVIAASALSQGVAWVAPGTGAAIHALARSADGARVVIGDITGELRVIDAARREVRVVGRAAAPIEAIDVSADARHALVTLATHEVQAWDLASGAASALPLTPDSAALAMSPDGDRIATAGQLCALAAGRCAALPAIANARMLAFSADGTRLIAAELGALRVFDVTREPPTLERELAARRAEGILRVGVNLADAGPLPFAWSRDARTLAVLGPTGMLELVHDGVAREAPLLCTGLGLAARGGIAVSPDGKRLACVGERDVDVYDLDTGTRVGATLRTTADTSAISFAQGGGALAVGTTEGGVVLRHLGSGVTRALVGHAGKVHRVEFVAGDRALATAGADGAVRLWPVAGGPRLLHPEGERAPGAAAGDVLLTAGGERGATATAILPDGRSVTRARPAPIERLALAPDGGAALIATAADREVWWPATGATSALPALALARGDRGLVRRGDDVAVVDLPDGHERWRVAAPGAPADAAVALADDASVAVIARGPRSLTALSARGARDLAIDDEVALFALAADGAQLFAATAHQAVLACDTSTGACRVLDRHDGRVTSLATTDGVLATASDDRTVHVTALATGRTDVLRRRGAVQQLGFARGRLWLVEGSELVLRDLATGEEQRTASPLGGADALAAVVVASGLRVLTVLGGAYEIPLAAPDDLAAALAAATNAEIGDRGALVAR